MSLLDFVKVKIPSIIEVFDTLSIIKTVEDTRKRRYGNIYCEWIWRVGQCAYSWSANDSIFSNSNEIYVSPDTTCVYHITVSDSCGDSISQSSRVLHVLESLDLNFSYVNNYGCSPLVVTFDLILVVSILVIGILEIPIITVHMDQFLIHIMTLVFINILFPQ